MARLGIEAVLSLVITTNVNLPIVHVEARLQSSNIPVIIFLTYCRLNIYVQDR